MADKLAIRVDGVSKDFVLPHEKVNSVKSLFTGLAKGSWRTKETQHALKDVSFEIQEGEFFGIVGRNGSGKSTLLKMLAGIYQPTKGKVHTRGKLVPFIELGVGFNPELTGRENIYLNGAMLGFSEKEVDAMYADIVSFAELERFMDQKLKNYSSGMQVRLAFSMATRSDADILLIDEILAVGDADFQRKCFDYFKKLKGRGTTVVFVTHDMNAVREYCDRAVLIESSELVEEGSPDKIAGSYARMFIDQKEVDDKQDDRRWGDKAIQYTHVTTSKKKLTSSDAEIVLTARAVARQDVDDPIFGFSARNAAGVQILGTNTLMLKKAISHVKKGEIIELEWRIPNVLNDGIHHLDPAIVYNGATQTADWWEGAVSLTVMREDKTPYMVHPRIDLSVKRKGSR